MAIRILTDEQRKQYARFTENPSSDQIAQYFHLDATDREIIQRLRGNHNRLGFALMLCAARFIGVFADQNTPIPKPVIFSLTRQLKLRPDMLLEDYFKGWQRTRHLLQILATQTWLVFLPSCGGISTSSGVMTSHCLRLSPKVVSGHSETILPNMTFEKPYATFPSHSCAQADSTES